jgi:hypothetical protein
MLAAATHWRLASRGPGARRAVAARRLLLEPLEARQLLAILVPVTGSAVTGDIAVNSVYQVSGTATEATQKTAHLSDASAPALASVAIDRSDLANAYGDSVTGSIDRQQGTSNLHLDLQGYATSAKYVDPPADTVTARTSSVSYDIGANSPIVLRIDPEAGEKVGDPAGITVQALVAGHIFGDADSTAPIGAVNAQGTYTYTVRIVGGDSSALNTYSGSGSLAVGGPATLDNFGTGPVNVPIGSQIEISLRINGSLNTTDLNATAQVQSQLTLDVSAAKADLVAESLAWNVAGSTDQAARNLDFAYFIDGVSAPLVSNANVDFYWAAGSQLSDVIGTLDTPIYSFTIDQAAEKTAGSHAGSVALSQLGTPAEGATQLLMVVDRLNTISEITKSNNIKTLDVLSDVEMVGLNWNTRRDQDPYGGWRGVDAQYEVHWNMAAAGQVAFYWASGTTLDTRIGSALTPRANDTSLGLHQFNESALWGTRPADARYVLAVFDPDNSIPEWNEQNNVTALPVHTAEEILNGSLDLNPLGAGLQGITSLTVWFKPGGGAGQQGQFTVSEAEVALGVHHFNWYQQIQNVPSHWTLYQDTSTSGLTSTSRVAVPLPWIDPSNEVPDQSYLVLESSLAGKQERFASNPNDNEIYYYNEPGFDHSQQTNIAGVTRASSIVFTDAPRVPMQYLATGEAWQFITSLEGVDAQGRIVSLPLASQRTFTWKSNTVYNPDDPAHPVSGGGIFLQALNEATLPPAVAGGVTDVALYAADPPVAAADTATTIVATPAMLRVLANDYDPEGSTLRIESAGNAQHGTVTIHDAGTPADWADDYVLYTPTPGFVGPDTFQYMASRTGEAGGYAVAQVTITVLPALAGLGAVGGSLSDEYAGQSLGDARNWVELLGTSTSVDLGPYATWNDSRQDGYAYNWASAGATSQSNSLADQLTGLAEQAAAASVSRAVVAIGQEDFLPGADAYQGIYYQGLTQFGGWTAEQISAYADSVVASIQNAVTKLRQAGIQPVVMNLIDFGASPGAVGSFPDASRRALVAAVIADINLRIADLAATNRVPLADAAGISKVVLGTASSPADSAAIGGVSFTNTAGQDAQNLFTADGVHPHTIIQAIYANLVLEAFRLGYGEAVSPTTERAMIEAAGLTYGGQDTLNLDYSAYVIKPANEMPVAAAERYVAEQGSTLVIDALGGVLSNDTDANGDRLQARLVDGGPLHGTLTLAADGGLHYLPTPGYVGSDRFSYLANDGYGNSAPVTVEISVVAQGTRLGDTIGLFSPDESLAYLRNSNSAGGADRMVAYGAPGSHWKPLTGDWDGNGSVTLGLYDPDSSLFYLANSSSGFADAIVAFGNPGGGWLPVSGDWDGDGVVTIGLYDPKSSVFYLTDNPGGGMADRIVPYGAPDAGWMPIAGDWTGQGFDAIGLYDPKDSVFYLRTSNTAGMANIMFGYGQPGGWLPVVGDWNSDQVDTVGLYDPQGSTFYLRNANSSGFADLLFGYGQPDAGWLPIAGNWDGVNAQPVAASTASVSVAATTTQSTATQNAATLDPRAVDGLDLAGIAQQAASEDNADELNSLLSSGG